MKLLKVLSIALFISQPLLAQDTVVCNTANLNSKNTFTITGIGSNQVKAYTTLENGDQFSSKSDNAAFGTLKKEHVIANTETQIKISKVAGIKERAKFWNKAFNIEAVLNLGEGEDSEIEITSLGADLTSTIRLKNCKKAQ